MGVSLLLVLCLVVGVVQGANPNYSYHIKIDDAAHANFQEKAETRKGPDAVGFYSVVDPNGSLRTVEYTADDRGFNPTVTYSHAGNHVYHQHGASGVGTYAPAFVQDSRVQIVDKFTGPPPALNIQPFHLPQPSLGFGVGVANSGPLVVPAPVRAAPAPELIAQGVGVEYAPAYMPPVTAFVQQQTYLPPPPPPRQVAVQVAQPVREYLPPPPPQVSTYHHYLPPQQQQIAYQVAQPVRAYFPPPQVQVDTYLPPPPPQVAVQVAQPVRAYLPPPPQVAVEVAQPVKTYLPPPQVEIAQPIKTYLPPPQVEVAQPIKTYLPPPQVATYLPPRQVATYLPPPPPQREVIYEQSPPPAIIAVEKPSPVFSLPKKQQILSVEKAQVSLIQQDSYAVPPTQTVTDLNGPVYPESIRVVDKLRHTYGPPNFTPGQPIGIEVTQPAQVVVKKPVQVHVSVVGPPPTPVKEVVHVQQPELVQYAPQYTPQVQYAPQVQYVQPQVQKFHQVVNPQPQVAVQVAAPVAQRVVATHTAQPALGLYAGAIGFHTGNSGPTQYLHSYGTQGFQVTSSRQFNKVIHQQQVAVPVAAAPAPIVQHNYHQQVAVPVAQAPTIHHHIQHHQPEVYAPQYLPPPQPQVAVQVHHQPQQLAVPIASSPAVYGPPPQAVVAVPAVAAPAIAVPVGGRKKNPLTFEYSYDQGGAKVSHSYSGSGW